MARRLRMFGPGRASQVAANVKVALAAVVILSSVSVAAQREPTFPEERIRNPYAWPSLRTLVERSDTVVAGEVLDMRSAWTVDRREIFTTVTLRPDRRFKGGRGSLIRFRIPGGTAGDIRLEVTHSDCVDISTSPYFAPPPEDVRQHEPHFAVAPHGVQRRSEVAVLDGSRISDDHQTVRRALSDPAKILAIHL